MKKITKNTILKQNGIEYKAVNHAGIIYWYREALGAHRKTLCLATNDPTSYCNGVYLYSDKDPGSGKVFEVVAQTIQEKFHEHIPIVRVDAQYNEVDLLKAINLAQTMYKEMTIVDNEEYSKISNPVEGTDYFYTQRPKYTPSQIIEMVSEIECINVDEYFNEIKSLNPML